jgi:hypothetical protein
LTRSHAILVGTSSYDSNLTPLPAAGNSLDRLSRLLVGPHCGWPADAVSTYHNPIWTNGFGIGLAKLIHETRDVLLFYYVGHGLPTQNDDLCMALVDTLTDPYMREHSGLRWSPLRQMIYGCPAQVKIIIIDCCFSGIVVENRQAANLEPTGLADLTRMRGAYVITASDANATALYEDGPNPLTHWSVRAHDG